MEKKLLELGLKQGDPHGQAEVLISLASMLPKGGVVEKESFLAETISLYRKCGGYAVDPLKSALIKVTTVMGVDEELKGKVTQGTVILEQLSNWFYAEKDPAKELVLLDLLVKFTGNLSTSCCPSFLNQLLEKCFRLVQANPKLDNDAVTLALATLLNVCQASPHFPTVLRSVPDFRPFWNCLQEVLDPVAEAVQSQNGILVLHLLILLDISNDPRFLRDSCIRLTLLYGRELVRHISEADFTEQRTKILLIKMVELNRCLGTLFRRLQSRLLGNNPAPSSAPIIVEEDGCTQSQSDAKKDDLLSKDKCRELILKMIRGVLKEVTPRFADQVFLKVTLELLQTCVPPFLSAVDLGDVITDVFEKLSDLRSDPPSLQTHQVMPIYLHVISKLMETGGKAALHHRKAIERAISMIIWKREDKSWTGVADDIFYCRLLTVLASEKQLLHNVQKVLVAEKVLDRLNRILILEPSQDKYAEINRNTAVIEMLAMLSVYAQPIHLLNDLVDTVCRKDVAVHVAIGFFSGDKMLISSCWKVIETVLFSKKCMNAISNEVAAMGVVSGINSKGFHSLFTPTAIQGIGIVNETLEVLTRTHKRQRLEEQSVVQDVVSLYELKTSVYEKETQSINMQLKEANATTENYKKLFQAQVDLMAKRLSTVEGKDLQLQIQADQLEHERKTNEENISSLRQQLAIKDALVVHKDAKLTKAEGELAVSIKNATTLSEQNSALKTELEKQGTAQASCEEVNAKLRKKMASLEREMRHKDEELKHINGLLEKEKRTVDTIRGLLGQNIDIRSS